jgi:hypothetical protein
MATPPGVAIDTESEVETDLFEGLELQDGGHVGARARARLRAVSSPDWVSDASFWKQHVSRR